MSSAIDRALYAASRRPLEERVDPWAPDAAESEAADLAAAGELVPAWTADDEARLAGRAARAARRDVR